MKNILASENQAMENKAADQQENLPAFVPAQVVHRDQVYEEKVITVFPKEKSGWYYLLLNSRDLKLFSELLSGVKSYKVREYQGTRMYRFKFQTFIYTTADHRKRMEKCVYSESEFQKHMDSVSRDLSDMEAGGESAEQDYGERESTGGGFLFVHAPVRKLNKILGMIVPHRFVARDFVTRKAARIPDVQMKEFIQIYESLPWNINILKYPISRYADTRHRIRITGGVLKGLEGFIVRIHKDRNLVFSFGSMTLAIGGIHAIPFKVIA